MILCMLRRASLDLDVNRINMAGMTALHQVVMVMVFVTRACHLYKKAW